MLRSIALGCVDRRSKPGDGNVGESLEDVLAPELSMGDGESASNDAGVGQGRSGKTKLNVKNVMKNHLQGTKRVRLCLLLTPVVMLLVIAHAASVRAAHRRVRPDGAGAEGARQLRRGRGGASAIREAESGDGRGWATIVARERRGAGESLPSGRTNQLSLIHISEPRDQRGSRMPSSA